MRKAIMGMCGVAWTTLHAANVNVSGTVQNSSGKPVAGAVVTLVGQKASVTSGADGKYTFAGTTSTHDRGSQASRNVTLANGVLELNVTTSSPLSVEVFDVGGRLLKTVDEPLAAPGVYRWDLAGHARSSRLLLVQARVGTETGAFRYVSMGDGRGATMNVATVSGALARTSAVVDTLKVEKSGYLTAKIPLSSLETTQNVVLDTALIVSGRSAGCGKDLGSLKAGNNPLKIQSGAYQRDYTINIPNNYDKNRAHRLIFTWHWINASDDAVVNGQVSPGGGANWAYFGLKRMADSAGVPVVFIAPSSRTGTWGQEDHVLFDDLLKLYKTNLCIDTARVFATGFSFGAMQTYSLSTGKKQHLRAVATLAAANFNIYLPTYQSNLDIAYLGITGMSDGTCPWDRGNGKDGALYISRQHAQTNGCTIPATVPTTNVGSKSHLVYDYQNCKAGYPVKVITFDGGHIAAPADGGTSDNGTTTWAPRESWKFFMQF